MMAMGADMKEEWRSGGDRNAGGFDGDQDHNAGADDDDEDGHADDDDDDDDAGDGAVRCS